MDYIENHPDIGRLIVYQSPFDFEVSIVDRVYFDKHGTKIFVLNFGDKNGRTMCRHFNTINMELHPSTYYFLGE